MSQWKTRTEEGYHDFYYCAKKFNNTEYKIEIQVKEIFTTGLYLKKVLSILL